MIKQITDINKLNLCSYTDIYEGKIKVLYETYGFGSKFCSFYCQGESLLISKLDCDFVVKTYEKDFDAEELASFLKLSNARGVFLSSDVLKAIEPFISGEYLFNNLMEYNAHYKTERSGLLDAFPRLDDVFEILKHDFNITHDLWLTDVSHRIRHGISTVYLYDKVSSATVLYDKDDIVFITQVATKFSERGKGIATKMLREIADTDRYKNKQILLVCRNKMLSFYENAGFKKIGEAAQIYRLDN